MSGAQKILVEHAVNLYAWLERGVSLPRFEESEHVDSVFGLDSMYVGPAQVGIIHTSLHGSYVFACRTMLVV